MASAWKTYFAGGHVGTVVSTVVASFLVEVGLLGVVAAVAVAVAAAVAVAVAAAVV